MFLFQAWFLFYVRVPDQWWRPHRHPCQLLLCGYIIVCCCVGECLPCADLLCYCLFCLHRNLREVCMCVWTHSWALDENMWRDIIVKQDRVFTCTSNDMSKRYVLLSLHFAKNMHLCYKYSLNNEGGAEWMRKHIFSLISFVLFGCFDLQTAACLWLTLYVFSSVSLYL